MSNALTLPSSGRRCRSVATLPVIEAEDDEDECNEKPKSTSFGRRMSTAIFAHKHHHPKIPVVQKEDKLTVPATSRRRHSCVAPLANEVPIVKEAPPKPIKPPGYCRRLSTAIFSVKHDDTEDALHKDGPLIRPFFPAKSYDFSFKILLLGDAGVGKTCLLLRLKRGIFLRSTPTTLGVDYKDKELNVDESKVSLRIWDTAGAEKFKSLTPTYYRDADALLLLYDVSNEKSFLNTRSWLTDAKENAPDDVVIMLVGNKCDVAESDRKIGRKRGVKLARDYKAQFMETSAKNGQNVELAFLTISRVLINNERNPPSDNPAYSLFHPTTRCQGFGCE